MLAFGEVTVEGDALQQLLGELERLHTGEPLAYITGSREFYALEFAVSPQVLIPRADTELLVELGIQRCPTGASVVDLGTGSGAIAVSLKNARPDLALTATDVSLAALAVAKDNAARHNCAVTFVHSNWFATLPGSFDVIISNPPYIRPNDSHLPALHHEPQSALVAADNGMADLCAITEGATAALNSGGQLLVEHGFDQADQVSAQLKHCGFAKIEVHDDLAGLPRVTSGTRC